VDETSLNSPDDALNAKNILSLFLIFFCEVKWILVRGLDAKISNKI
jgi:hypothetical protein